ncbi:hypothetical protein DVH24_023170 [Malus domestica]|uniref:Chalcone/stilbene synthase C-terminal domain-containing protein n=1 Tax=Malus domestica TaxID=3750 RepID=A0A498KNE0_MALDO|nr:hypothetical protein DVH24_023170 [Malus domestica]
MQHSVQLTTREDLLFVAVGSYFNGPDPLLRRLSLLSSGGDPVPPKVAEGVGLNLKTRIEHFRISPGGKAIIDGIGESLGLSHYDVELSRMALHRFGNTSAAGFWYALRYMGAKKRLKKGNRILMSRFGARFKCNNIVWEVMKDLDDVNVWKDCVDSYPTDQTLVNTSWRSMAGSMMII